MTNSQFYSTYPIWLRFVYIIEDSKNEDKLLNETKKLIDNIENILPLEHLGYVSAKGYLKVLKFLYLEQKKRNKMMIWIWIKYFAKKNNHTHILEWINIVKNDYKNV